MNEYPSRDGRWMWDDLALLAKALGYHNRVFFENATNCKEKDFMKYEDLVLFLEGDDLYPALHKTYNHQDGSYNLKVVSKAINLLQQRYLSFSMVQVARVSFQTYESSDHAGLEDGYVLKALKLCGRSIAPTRLRQLLQHMDRLVADRVMLYEFLDLVASADLLEKVEKEIPPKKDVCEKVDERSLYDLCDFEDELCTSDERCYRHLDKQFEELLKIIPVKEANSIDTSPSKSRQEWVTPPLANRSIRKQMTNKSRLQGDHLSSFLHSSNNKVKKCMCGNICQCATADFCQLIDDSKQTPDLGDSNTIIEKETEVPVETKVTIKSPLVTQKDKEETLRKIQDIQWEMATQKQSSQRKLMKNFSS